MPNMFVSANDNSDDAGLYTWQLETNTVYGDAAVADLYGLDPAKAEHGMPIQSYLERVHPDDKPTLAQSISDAIQTSRPFQASYRVLRADGLYVLVTAFGKCFADEANEPKFYSGIVFPMPVDMPVNADLRWLCVAAYDGAKRAGRADIEIVLRKALEMLGVLGHSSQLLTTKGE